MESINGDRRSVSVFRGGGECVRCPRVTVSPRKSLCSDCLILYRGWVDRRKRKGVSDTTIDAFRRERPYVVPISLALSENPPKGSSVNGSASPLAPPKIRRDGPVIEFASILAREAVSTPMPGFVTASPKVKEVIEAADRLRGTSLQALVCGETGSGKDLVMRFLAGDRKPRIIDCGALSAEMAESQLFGHRRGSFTGAVADQPGLLEVRPGSMIEFDEVAKLPLSIQPKLLRFLETGAVRRLGNQEEKLMTDCQIVAATNRDLGEMTRKGQFLEDLFYRLDRIRVQVPPLRDRLEDIEVLVAHIGRKHGLEGVTTGALANLRGHGWPGNVRELENVISRARFKTTGPTIRVVDLEF